VRLDLKKVDTVLGGIHDVVASDTPGVGTNPLDTSHLWLQYDKTFPNRVGIEWNATLSLGETKNFGGSFAVTQTIETTTKRTFVVNDQTTTQQYYLYPDGTAPGVMLDRLHAPNAAGDKNSVQTVGFLGQIQSWDNPGINLHQESFPAGVTPGTYTKSDNFVTTLMYRPWVNSILENSIWTPVGSLTWSWDGKAKWVGGPAQPWVEDGAQVGGVDSNYAPTSTFPTWNTSTSKQKETGWKTIP
jgi:hypothetical protein